MSVYVDDMRRPARLTGRPAKWSHLLADTHQELMSMAAEMGLDRAWIQHEGTHREHFDVTEAKRLQAIGFGAVPIRYPRQTAKILQAKREAALMTTPPPLCGGDHDEAGIDNCDACQAEVVEPRCRPDCPACRDDGREYMWGVV